MEIRVLGPVELELGGRRLRLGGPKQRALLSFLALNANLAVSVDRLIEGLWGEEPPASAAKMVQLYVSQLRKLLAEEAGAEIVTHGRGCQLRLDRGAGGVGARARALAVARRASRRPRRPFAWREIARLDDLRVAALEQLVEAKLALGRHHLGAMQQRGEFPLPDAQQAGS